MNSLKLILTSSRYFAPALVFASLNVIFGTWAIYIPTIKSRLQIDENELGIAIFFMALGTLILITLAPKLINSLGVGKATCIGLFIFLVSFIIPFIVSDYKWFCLGMFGVGAASGFTDVAMNALVSEIEKQDGVHIMSATHGFFSLGGFVGAGIGGFFLRDSILPIEHLLVVITMLILANLIFFKKYIKVDAVKLGDSTFSFKSVRPVILLGFIAFFILATEGAIIDWSALYLEKISEAPMVWIGLGYTIFSATMALGRFFGDGISVKFGAKNLVIYGTLIASIGFVGILLIQPLYALIGFGLVGIGLSVVIPELFRLAGAAKGLDSSLAISFVSGIGFSGFLIGPVLLGFVAGASSLWQSFVVLLIFILISFISAFTLEKKETNN